MTRGTGITQRWIPKSLEYTYSITKATISVLDLSIFRVYAPRFANERLPRLHQSPAGSPTPTDQSYESILSSDQKGGRPGQVRILGPVQGYVWGKVGNKQMCEPKN